MKIKDIAVLLFTLWLLASGSLYAQTKLGGDPSSTNPGASLELGTTNQGLLLNRVSIVNTTTWGLLGTAVTGMQVFNISNTVIAGSTAYPSLAGGVGIYYWDGTGWVGVTPGKNQYWGTKGNAGTSSSMNFLGTTDNQALSFKVNGQPAGFIDNSLTGNNLFFGLSAGSNNVGTGNTFIGGSAGFGNTLGVGNSFLGANSGSNIISGSQNTFLGSNANATGANAGTLINATAIGANAQVGESNALVLGSIGTNAVNVGIGTTTPVAALDVTSTTSGILVPRLTTAQRANITGAALVDGLMIYNTDEQCFDYYSATAVAWITYCGTQGITNAAFSISNCAGITVNGVYAPNLALTPSNYLAIPVTVTSAGPYTITGTTTDGFFFSASGTFPASGTFTVNVPGTGTPSTTAGTYPVSLKINGVAVTTCMPNVVVSQYLITCGNITVNGTYAKGLALTGTNTLSVPVTVYTTGATYNISTNTVNGYSFSASGTFAATGAQTITLTGSGTPAVGRQTDNFTVTGVNSGSSCSVAVPVSTYTINCGSIVANGGYAKGTALTGANTLSVPVTVSAVGPYTLSGTTTNGYSFNASGTFAGTGVQTITLTGSGTPNAGSQTDNVTVTGTGTNGNCSTQIFVAGGVGTFTNAAQNCLAIKTAAPSSADGEYWISNGAGGTVKTMCDMTDGGYTMLWSFSENTASAIGNGTAAGMPGQASFATGSTAASIYGNDGLMSLTSNGFTLDAAQNVVTTASGTINYANYRLSLATMKNIQQVSGGPSLYLVRITNNATSMTDSWALQNYLFVTPKVQAYDEISGVSQGGASVGSTTQTAQGKIWGNTFLADGVNTKIFGNITAQGGPVLTVFAYNDFANNLYGSHFDSGPGRLGDFGSVTKVLAPDGVTMISPNVINNLFGFFFEQEQNHHFGKCGGFSGDDTSFAITDCAATGAYTNTTGLAPHKNINVGLVTSGVPEGRILQWFVK